MKPNHELTTPMHVDALLRPIATPAMIKQPFLFILLLTTFAIRAADPLSDTLQQGLRAEEVDHNLDDAIAAYQSVIALHDDQRRLVATALFRLGESYRKQGKTAEAVAQYQRLVVEFSDQAELARLSRLGLQTLGAGIPIPIGPLTPAAQRQKDLLAQELALVEQQIAEVRAKVSVGAAGTIDLIPLQREALSLQRQMAALDDARLPDLLLPSAAVVEPSTEVGGASEEELREIERLEVLIRNSPDLINSSTGQGGLPLRGAAVKGWLAVVRFLIENGANLEVHDGDRRTPLHLAVQSGHKAMTELLIAAGAHIEARDSQDLTPLHRAASQGFIEIAKVLLSAGADVNAAAPEGTPLHTAVMNGRVAMIDLLSDHGANLEARTSERFAALPSFTPLLQAVSVNFDPGVVELLLARGANANATNAAGDSVLHATIVSEKSGPGLQAILEKQPDLEARGSQNLTPLQVACVQRKYSAVRVLLEAGANPNVRFEQAGTKFPTVRTGRGQLQRRPDGSTVSTIHYEPDGSTPLHWAVGEWDRRLTQMLIEHDADPNATDNDGATPMLAAAMQGMGGGTLVTDPVVIRLLLNAGADPDVHDKNGMSLLQHALRVGSVDLVEALLEHGADPNAADYAGTTPLHAAALWSTAKPVQLLLDRGAELDRPDGLGNTALHIAAYAANRETVQLLLDRGAPVNARNQRDQTPLDLAQLTQTTYSMQPGHGLVLVTALGSNMVTTQFRQLMPSASHIAAILIEHGAEGVTPDPPSLVPAGQIIPRRAIRSAPEPAPPEAQPAP